MRVYLGYSLVHSGDQIKQWLDVDPSHPEGTSVFERMFGCSYIRPGDFEVYGVGDMDGGFTVSEIKLYFPFKMGCLNLWEIDLAAITSLFWIRSESKWETMEAGGIIISDVLNVKSTEYDPDRLS